MKGNNNPNKSPSGPPGSPGEPGGPEGIPVGLTYDLLLPMDFNYFISFSLFLL